MRQTTKEWMNDVRGYIASDDRAAIVQSLNHPKMLYATLALSEVARTGNVALLEQAIEGAVGSEIMDLTNVFKSVVGNSQVEATQWLLDWAQSNNTFPVAHPYEHTVFAAAIKIDCVELLERNAHHLYSVPKNLMQTYYLQAVEQQSLGCLEYLKEHMDVLQLRSQGIAVAVDKLKPISLRYFLDTPVAGKHVKNAAGTILIELCIKNSLTSKEKLTDALCDVLLVVMDFVSPEEVLGRFNGGENHPFMGTMKYVNNEWRAEQQAKILTSHLPSSTLGSARKI